MKHDRVRVRNRSGLERGKRARVGLNKVDRVLWYV